MLSEALRLLRVFHDLKQKELAKKMGVSNSLISEIENGNRTPSLDVVHRYSETFKIPVSSIMFFSENIENAQQRNVNGAQLQQAIASKIISFLKLIEDRTQVDVA